MELGSSFFHVRHLMKSSRSGANINKIVNNANIAMKLENHLIVSEKSPESVRHSIRATTMKKLAISANYDSYRPFSSHK